MLEIRIFGWLRKKFDEKSSLAGDMIKEIPYIENENFISLLERLNVTSKDCGDCFINGKVAKKDTLIEDNSRIALFSQGMYLLCGGQHYKGTGYITKEPEISHEYYTRD